MWQFFVQLTAEIFFFNFILFLNLKHCISFAKYQNESATGIHVLPILNPPPSPHHPCGSSQCTSPKHPVSCIEPGVATHFSLVWPQRKRWSCGESQERGACVSSTGVKSRTHWRINRGVHEGLNRNWGRKCVSCFGH